MSTSPSGPAPAALAEQRQDADAFWKAFANPRRRQILDELGTGPKTTGELADAMPEVSRFAVMQHLGVLTDAGVVLVERRGRYRFNHVNAAALRGFYERWVSRYADAAATELTALQRHLEEEPMETETVKVLRLESELRFRAPPERVFKALTDPGEI